MTRSRRPPPAPAKARIVEGDSLANDQPVGGACRIGFDLIDGIGQNGIALMLNVPIRDPADVPPGEMMPATSTEPTEPMPASVAPDRPRHPT